MIKYVVIGFMSVCAMLLFVFMNSDSEPTNAKTGSVIPAIVAGATAGAAGALITTALTDQSFGYPADESDYRNVARSVGKSKFADGCIAITSLGKFNYVDKPHKSGFRIKCITGLSLLKPREFNKEIVEDPYVKKEEREEEYE